MAEQSRRLLVEDVVRGPPGGESQSEAGGSRISLSSSESSASSTSSGQVSIVSQDDSTRKEGFDCDWVGSVDKKYECPICLLVQKDPVQTLCGHRYCKPCIKRWLKEKASPVCPSCNAPLDKRKLFPDIIAQREILGLQVSCPNKDCHDVMDLSQKNKHMDTCEYGLTPCPNRCSAILRRRSLEHHMAVECSQRSMPCDKCGATVPMDQKELHPKTCPNATVHCEYCGHQFLNRELEDHVTSSCLQVPMPCVYQRFGCTSQVERCMLDNHYTSEVHHHLELVSKHVTHGPQEPRPLQSPPPADSHTRVTQGNPPWLRSFPAQQHSCDSQSTSGYGTTTSGLELGYSFDGELGVPSVPAVYPQTVDANYKDVALSHPMRRPLTRISSHPQYLPSSHPYSDPLSTRPKQQAGVYESMPPPGELGTERTRPSSEQDLVYAYKKQLTQAQQSVVRLENMVHIQADKLAAYERTITDMQKTIHNFEGRHCNGTFYWRIKEYHRKRRETMGGSPSALHSPPFYSGSYGYKMCLRLNLNGVDTAFGTHLSVFLHFMRSENDDILKWPFRGKITLSIVDQNENTELQNHIVETLSSNPDLLAFQRPTSSRNHKGFGYVEFAPITHVENRTYIKNDTLIIKAVIEAAN